MTFKIGIKESLIWKGITSKGIIGIIGIIGSIQSNYMSKPAFCKVLYFLLFNELIK